MHECYKPENANKLKELRALERKQRRGLLTQGGLYRIWELKDQLGIGKCVSS